MKLKIEAILILLILSVVPMVVNAEEHLAEWSEYQYVSEDYSVYKTTPPSLKAVSNLSYIKKNFRTTGDFSISFYAKKLEGGQKITVHMDYVTGRIVDIETVTSFYFVVHRWEHTGKFRVSLTYADENIFYSSSDITFDENWIYVAFSREGENLTLHVGENIAYGAKTSQIPTIVSTIIDFYASDSSIWIDNISLNYEPVSETQTPEQGFRIIFIVVGLAIGFIVVIIYFVLRGRKS